LGSEAVRKVDKYNIVAAATTAGSSMDVDDCSVKVGSATEVVAVVGTPALGDNGLKDGAGREGLPFGAQPQ
jgi:hypothetical protein